MSDQELEYEISTKVMGFNCRAVIFNDTGEYEYDLDGFDAPVHPLTSEADCAAVLEKMAETSPDFELGYNKACGLWWCMTDSYKEPPEDPDRKRAICLAALKAIAPPQAARSGGEG